MLISWLRQLMNKRVTTYRRPTKLAKRKVWFLAVEALEDRTVPAFLAPLSAATSFTASATAVGDFNGDGIPDIVSVGSLSGRGAVDVQLGNGDGSFQAEKISNSGNTSPIQVKVGDLNGDGKLDVVVLGSYYIDSLTVLKGNGDGTFQPPTPYSYSIPPTEIQLGDVNGDGHPDLIAGNHFFSTTSVMLNDGTGHFGPKVDSGGVLTPSDLATADFNGDGKLDVVSTSQYGSGVNVQLGNGNGTFLTPKPYLTGASPMRSLSAISTATASPTSLSPTTATPMPSSSATATGLSSRLSPTTSGFIPKTFTRATSTATAKSTSLSGRAPASPLNWAMATAPSRPRPSSPPRPAAASSRRTSTPTVSPTLPNRALSPSPCRLTTALRSSTRPAAR